MYPGLSTRQFRTALDCRVADQDAGDGNVKPACVQTHNWNVNDVMFNELKFSISVFNR